MKRYIVVLITVTMFASSLLTVQTLFAQQNPSDAIALNDATPGVDVVITPALNTTGVVSLELVQASVTVVDSLGNTTFQMADARVHKLELRLAPGTGSYTLSAERLPGVAEAYVRITSQADLTDVGQTILIDNAQQPLGIQTDPGQTVLVENAQPPLGMQQSLDLPLNSAAPSQVVPFNIPADQQGTLKASFPGAPVTAQVVDTTGQVLATLIGGGFDGVSMVLDSGSYQLTLMNTNPAQQQTVANMEVAQALPSVLDSEIPALVAQSTCMMTVNSASVNLRSGPGTGYSVINYGFRNEQYQVGGQNADGSWLVIGTSDGGSAWVSRNTGDLTNACDNLAVYDIPYRDAPQPQVVVVQQQPSTVVVPGSSAPAASAPAPAAAPTFHEDDEHEGHEGHDD
jgi:uncharacterized protein YraI